MIIVGFDPGLATLGYGVIKADNRYKPEMIDYGIISTPKDENLAVRLAMLEKGVKQVIDKFKPDEIAVEELFFAKNVKTGIAVAHARGVALLTATKHCGKLYEYTPMQIKQALTGYGKADKKQMQQVVASLLKLKSIPKPDDAADALAVGLCHAFTNRFGELFAVGNMTRGKGKNTQTDRGAYLIAEMERRRTARLQAERAKRQALLEQAATAQKEDEKGDNV